MKRKAIAVWRRDAKTGRGTLSSENTVLREAQDLFSIRFENGIRTNPDELLAVPSAHTFK